MVNNTKNRFAGDSNTGSFPLRWLLLGICGAGMRSLCRTLLARGDFVVGADYDAAALQGCRDQHVESVRQGQLQLLHQQTPTDSCGDQLKPSHFNRVVHSLAVNLSSAYSGDAQAAGVPVLSLPEAVNCCFERKRQICVAGTHGKTTTSGMLWWILQHQAATECFIGGELKTSDWSAGSELSITAERAVIESCEFRRSFLNFRPAVSVLTGIEADHFDCYENEAELTAAYREFVEKTAADGTLIYNADCRLVSRLAESRNCRKTGFSTGFTGLAAWSIRNAGLNSTDNCTKIHKHHWSFQMRHQDGRVIDVSLPVPGLHNARNAAAALLAAECEGIALETAAASLGTFPGVCRRFEYRGSVRGAVMLDDYAHHPTAVRETLRTVRVLYPDRRITVVFEPHQVSRLSRLRSEFAAALLEANRVLVLPTLRAREEYSVERARHSAAELAQNISDSGGCSRVLNSLDQVSATLDDELTDEDVVITMGAGRTNTIHDQINRRIQRDFAA